VNFLKSVQIKNYGHESVAILFWPTLYVYGDDILAILCIFYCDVSGLCDILLLL